MARHFQLKVAVERNGQPIRELVDWRERIDHTTTPRENYALLFFHLMGDFMPAAFRREMETLKERREAQ